jgi:small secreted domain DUF320
VNKFKKAAVMLVAGSAMIISGAGVANAGTGTEAVAVGSPGVLSGNNIQIPIHIPINLCGNTIDIIGVLNPAIGNTCINADGHQGGHRKDEHQGGGYQGGGEHQGGGYQGGGEHQGGGYQGGGEHQGGGYQGGGEHRGGDRG